MYGLLYAVAILSQILILGIMTFEQKINHEKHHQMLL
jgi:hypothetical protein